MSKPKEILVTTALPYANYPLHLGHILEQVQADIFVRYHRLRGKQVRFVCADDAHGTAIMLAAKRDQLSELEVIEKYSRSHQADSKAFLIGFDIYHSTHSAENERFLQAIFEALKTQNYLYCSEVSQLYDEAEGLFLPDRMVKGQCPYCQAEDQYGDNCEICGRSYAATELKNPYSTVSGSSPSLKQSEHWFLDLPKFTHALKAWIQTTPIAESVKNKLAEWFIDGLKPWDISRDAPYFGFCIPGTDSKKYFYVWVDAPVGYLSATWALCQRDHLNFDTFWKSDQSSEVYHFIGKDIAYFHTLFWPALLMAGSYRLPSNIFVHGYLNVNGSKMSKSRGTFILAETFLASYPAEALRYYFASKLDATIADLDLDLNDFVQKVNADLVNKIVNLAARVQPFIHTHFQGVLSATIDADAGYTEAAALAEAIATAYAQLNYKQVTQLVLQAAIQLNQYVDRQAPWRLAKNVDQLSHLHIVCSSVLNVFRLMIIYLQPILPTMAEKVKSFLKTDLGWETISFPLLNHRIDTYTPLFSRLTPGLL